ncbi:MAG: hypothetical protein R3F19_25060 [Verrucomicrobiales bacterium]
MSKSADQKAIHQDQLARNPAEMWQKVVLAKWLTRNAEVIISMSQPVASMSGQEVREIYQLINELSQGKAVLADQARNCRKFWDERSHSGDAQGQDYWRNLPIRARYAGERRATGRRLNLILSR